MGLNLLIDIDGTLYPQDSQKFIASSVYKEMRQRTISMLARKLKCSTKFAIERYEELCREYSKLISVGMKEKYGFNRLRYLRGAWDLDPRDHMVQNPRLRSVLESLSRKHSLLAVSDAPNVWAKKVLDYLKVTNCFERIFCGSELNLRKNQGLYELVLAEIEARASDCVMIGNEIETDIIIPRNLGMRTILVGEVDKNADLCIDNVNQLGGLRLD